MYYNAMVLYNSDAVPSISVLNGLVMFMENLADESAAPWYIFTCVSREHQVLLWTSCRHKN